MPISGAMPFMPAYIEGGGTVGTRHMVVKSGEDFVIGAPMTINAGEVDEIDTDDVTLVIGIAGAADASAYGYDMADQPSFVTGRANTVPVYVANRNTVFQGQLSNGTTALVVPDNANVDGVGYGIIRQTDGTWTVDEADTTNKLVQIVDYDLKLGGTYGTVFFKFFAAALAP